MSKLVLSMTAFGAAVIITASLGVKEAKSGIFQTPAGGWGVSAPPKTPSVKKGR